MAPFSLLLGFKPRSTVDFLPKLMPGEETSMKRESEDFLKMMDMHRENARLAIAYAQHQHALQYNSKRKETPLQIGDRALVNPHSLEWVESKGEGSKLTARWIGPFEVMDKI
ncbi:hypothetical protein GALMADRAFT_259957, partial [Galerina marginata CBS 339.88]